MSVRAVGFVGVPMAAPVHNVSHVVGLGSAFEVVGVAADTVVAAVPDDGGPGSGGEVVGYAVGGAVFAVDVELPVGVASSGALPFPTVIGGGDRDFLPKALCVAVQDHRVPTGVPPVETLALLDVDFV